MQRVEKINAVLRNPESFATSLLAICVDEYGTDVFSWDPETLWLELASEFVVPSRLNKDKIQALILAHTTDLPFTSVETFIITANVLNGFESGFDVLDIVTADEALWCVYEIMLNHVADSDGEVDDAPEFSDEVRAFLAVTLHNDGILEPPDVLKIADMAAVPSAAADDPVMFNAAWDRSRAESADLMAGLSGRIRDLARELDELPLRNRSSAWQSFRDRLLRMSSLISSRSAV